MAVRMVQPTGGIYFVTFTCYKWKSLFQLANSYDSVYKWFDYLSERKSSLLGYVIMPNHLHALIQFAALSQPLNTIISNAKRFMAYDIVRKLEAEKKTELLEDLYLSVKQKERNKGQKHKVFEESFDAKECYSQQFIDQKLNYMHYNPVRGKWNLATDFAMYPHSSAGYYFDTGANVYKQIMRVQEIN